MKERTIVRRSWGHIYSRDGRFFVDLFEPGLPIHSYTSLSAVKEMLYYQGILESRDADI